MSPIYIEDPTTTICLRSIKKEEIFYLWKIAYGADLEWMKWNGPYFNEPVFTRAEFKKMAENTYLDTPYRAVIVYENKLVGQVSAFWEDGKLKQWLEFGILLYDRRIWNKGVGTKAIELWITYLFTITPHIQRIGFTTWSGNKGMIKVGETLGMKKEAQIRSVRYYNQKYYDSIKFGVLRREWLMFPSS